MRNVRKRGVPLFITVHIAKESRTHKVYIHPLSSSTALKKLESR